MITNLNLSLPFLFFSKLSLALFWFLLGYYFYNYLIRGNNKNKLYIAQKIKSLSFFELTLIFYCFFYCFLSLEYFIVDSLVSLHSTTIDYPFQFVGEGGLNNSSNESSTVQLDSNSNNNIQNTNKNPTTEGNSTSTTSTISNVESSSSSASSEGNSSNRLSTRRAVSSRSNAGGDSAIMTTAFASGAHMAAQCKTPLGKVTTLIGFIGAGAGTVAVKNAIGNYTENLGKDKNNFLPENFNVEEIINRAFELSGNTGLDLLLLLQFFQKLQVIFLFILIYNLIINLINLNRVEKILLNFIPLKIVSYILKYLNYIQKSSKFIVLTSTLLLLYCNYQSFFILDFYLDNLDNLIEIYLKNKND